MKYEHSNQTAKFINLLFSDVRRSFVQLFVIRLLLF